MTETWRKVFRQGLAPQMTTLQLEVLRDGLVKDDPALIQGGTTTPPPMQCVMHWPCEAGCLIAYPVWKGGRVTVGEVEEEFARICFEIDKVMGEPAAVRHLLCWYDDAPRDVMRAGLVAEISRVLANRRVGQLSHGAVDVDVSPIPGVDDVDEPIIYKPNG